MERRQWVTHVGIALVNWQQEEPTDSDGRRRQPSKSGTSRINREIYVRFCERLGVKFPGPTRPDFAPSSRLRRLRRASRFGSYPAALTNFVSTLIPPKGEKTGGSMELPHAMFCSIVPLRDSDPLDALINLSRVETVPGSRLFNPYSAFLAPKRISRDLRVHMPKRLPSSPWRPTPDVH